MNIYLESGYINMKKIIEMKLPFNYIVGGRGTGKTYGTLNYLLNEDTRFMYMRRTQTQTDIINQYEFSPAKSICNDNNWDYDVKVITKGCYGVFINDNNQASYYNVALSTFSNIRGFDASDVTHMVYDEFIPEIHERPIKNECHALLNAYETVNRNRELKGQPPVQLICLANANNMANEIFITLNYIQIVDKMKKRNQEIYINSEKGVGIFLLRDSKISELKSDTALYKMAADTDYSDMALNNKFKAESERDNVVSVKLIEYKAFVKWDVITFYKHKYNNIIYCAIDKNDKNIPIYTKSEIDKRRFVNDYANVWIACMKNNLLYESYTVKALLTKLYKI